MSETVISPNMSLPVPTVTEAPGPAWATSINACLSILDQHNHSPGSGVPITPQGLDISSDLPFNGNNATLLRSARFAEQGAVLADPADLGCLYRVGDDLYYNDGAGVNIRITESGSVTGAAGTITGLPSGTASASYSVGTFTFNSATNTPANMAVGPLIIGRNAALSKTVTLSPHAAQAANFDMTLPTALPTSTQFLVSDSAGNLGYSDQPVGTGFVPLGGVIATFPNLAGAYVTVATTAADANGFVLCVGQVISDPTSPLDGETIPNLNVSRFLMGSDTAGNSAGSNTMPEHVHNMAHNHMFARRATDDDTFKGIFWSVTNDPSTTTIPTVQSTNEIFQDDLFDSGGTPASSWRNMAQVAGVGDQLYYTTGVTGNASSGTGSGALTGSVVGSIDNRPAFVTCVYIMRIR